MTHKQLIPFSSGLPRQQSKDWLAHLQQAMPDYDIELLTDDNACHFHDAEVAIVANPDVVVLNSLPKLTWVQSLWAGVEGLVSLLKNHVLICRMEDTELQQAMAEATLSWTLYLHRHMHLYREQQMDAVWLQHPVISPAQRTVSVLGTGVLGRATCKRLQLNGFTVKAWSRTEKHIPGLATFFGEDGLQRVLADADIVILLLPLTSETHHLFGLDSFNQMKRGACLINFARGEIIAKDALMTVLGSGKLGHAVLDVFDIEPLPIDDPLWKMPNVTVLPHISAPTNMVSASAIVAENIRNWLEMRLLPKVVDRQAGY